MRQIKYKMIALPILILTLASGCSSEVATENDEEINKEDKEFVITPENFPDTFLNGDIAKIYEQTSDEFQDIVSAEEFRNLGNSFNEDVKSYDLGSELSLNGYTEYQWINETKEKGIRSYFSEDQTIQGLELLPLSPYDQQDKVFTEIAYTMPVLNEWFTFWGGTNELVNYHYPVESQRYAFDLVIVNNGFTFEGERTNNESYYAFGELVLSAAEGM